MAGQGLRAAGTGQASREQPRRRPERDDDDGFEDEHADVGARSSACRARPGCRRARGHSRGAPLGELALGRRRARAVAPASHARSASSSARDAPIARAVSSGAGPPKRRPHVDEVPRAQDLRERLRRVVERRAEQVASTPPRPAPASGRSGSALPRRDQARARWRARSGTAARARAPACRPARSASSSPRRPAPRAARRRTRAVGIAAATSFTARVASRNIEKTSGCRSSSVSTMSPNGVLWTRDDDRLRLRRAPCCRWRARARSRPGSASAA